MKKKVLNTSGQTCNKFWVWSRYLSDTIANDENVIILNLDISFKDYPDLKNHKNLSFPPYSNTCTKLFGYKNHIKFSDRLLNNKFVKNKISSKILKGIFSIFNTEYILATTGSERSKNKIL